MKQLFFSILFFSFSITLFSQDVEKFITWENRSTYIPMGGTVPEVEFGQVLSLDINYSTDITAGVEEDLDYVAIQVRQVDAAFNIVKNSAFLTPIPGTAPNTTNGVPTTFTYEIPSVFEDDTPIPSSANLPTGNSLLLILFHASNSITEFVDANSELIITNPLSTSDFSKESISKYVYPNPTNGIINISDKINTETYKLYGLKGSLILNTEATGKLDLISQPKGFYILFTEAGYTKIVKQ